MSGAASPLMLATLFNRGLTVAVQLVVGTLLSPAEVGVFAVASAFCTLLNPFQSGDLSRISLQAGEGGGVAAAAAQIRDWLLAACALVLVGVMAATPLLPAHVDPRFLLVLALLPFLRVMGNARVALLSATGQADKVAYATVGEGVARGCGAIACAALGWGAASLLVAEVMAISVSTALLMRWQPLGRAAGWGLAAALRAKLGLSAAANLLMLVEREYATFAIGSFCAVAAGGSYFFANRIAIQLAVMLVPVITVETIPRLMQALREGRRADYLAVRRQEVRRLMRPGLVVAAALGLAGPVALLLIWGPRWREAAFMLPFVMAVAVLRLVYYFRRCELEAFGALPAILRLSAIDAALLLLLLTAAALAFGVPGVIAAFLGQTLLMLVLAQRRVAQCRRALA